MRIISFMFHHNRYIRAISSNESRRSRRRRVKISIEALFHVDFLTPSYPSRPSIFQRYARIYIYIYQPHKQRVYKIHRANSFTYTTFDVQPVAFIRNLGFGCKDTEKSSYFWTDNNYETAIEQLGFRIFDFSPSRRLGLALVSF